MLRKFFLILLVSLYLPAGVMAQDDDTLFTSNGFTNPNGVYLEVLGPGVLYSAGYERILLNQAQFKTSIQIGTAWYPESLGNLKLALPLTINEILSFNMHHLKIGVGSDMLIKRTLQGKDSMSFLAHLRIGYRYQRTDGKYFWEADIVPFLLGDSSAFELDALGSVSSHLWAGVTVGKAFGGKR
jgi:hypothetical protein